MENSPNFQKIILVDDDFILNRIHKKVLEIIGFHGTVLEFNNGFDAIEYIYQEIKHDFSTNSGSSLIVLDLEMPSLNGWGFLDRFGKLDPQVREKFKVIVSSSSFNPDDINRALAYESVIEYISKPLTIEIFRRIIGKDEG